MIVSCQLHQACHQDDVISHLEIRTSTVNSKRLDLTDLRCPSPELADLGFVRETLIFKNWNILDFTG